MTHDIRCRERIFSGARGEKGDWRPCPYWATRDGYCTIHHPDHVAARRAKAEAYQREVRAVMLLRSLGYTVTHPDREP